MSLENGVCSWHNNYISIDTHMCCPSYTTGKQVSTHICLLSALPSSHKGIFRYFLSILCVYFGFAFHFVLAIIDTYALSLLQIAWPALCSLLDARMFSNLVSSIFYVDFGVLFPHINTSVMEWLTHLDTFISSILRIKVENFNL